MKPVMSKTKRENVRTFQCITDNSVNVVCVCVCVCVCVGAQ